MSGALSDARAVVVVGLAGLVASCAPEGPSSVTPVDVAPMDGVLLVASSVDDVRGPHARIERWVFGGGEPEVTTLEEPRSDVMHVVRCDP
ncbi:MAG: hypothetical protein K1X94_32135, partial [Sandaracinaceae bacterium]|nr:hypothetical protein [Sandaracinaceae bacterium]